MSDPKFICVRVRGGDKVPVAQIEQLCASFLDNAERKDLLTVLVQHDPASSLPPGWIVADVDPSVRMVMQGWDTVLRSVLKRSPVMEGHVRWTVPFTARENIPGSVARSPSTAGVLHFEGGTAHLQRFAPDADGIMQLESVAFLELAA